jgi:hypothetical protein
MGIGPRFAIPAALQHVGIDINDVDLFEVRYRGPLPFYLYSFFLL